MKLSDRRNALVIDKMEIIALIDYYNERINNTSGDSEGDKMRVETKKEQLIEVTESLRKVAIEIMNTDLV